MKFYFFGFCLFLLYLSHSFYNLFCEIGITLERIEQKIFEIENKTERIEKEISEINDKTPYGNSESSVTEEIL